ncbi:hypothetical protein ELH02_14105 [Rhizobium ruizarguesonis]|uniref:hypothetical protein n=1 Tax=Rhizobium ruizarguesonis TaxID=2081791 RepID=UPI00102FBBDF|nr:hypothetical protein [Rhizobium ruizarguesonis]TBE45423.1 hypothetical protein ELH02_14105 [Rhizobium ruizarguesonis]
MTINTATPATASLPLGTVGVKVKQLTTAQKAAVSDAPIFLAPERGDPLTRHIECVPCVDIDALSSSQRADLQLGQKVVEAYWKAVQAYSLWCTLEQWPMFRCVRTALAVRDIFHAVGRKDALVAPVGVKLVRMKAGIELDGLLLGDPKAPVLLNKWNAHMVVRLGSIIFDPSHGQMQRSWNAAPDTLAIASKDKCTQKVSLYEMGKANIVTSYRYTHGGFDFDLAYFKLTRSVVERTRDWHDSPDASLKRRQPVVQAAVRLLQETYPRTDWNVAA